MFILAIALMAIAGCDPTGPTSRATASPEDRGDLTVAGRRSASEDPSTSAHRSERQVELPPEESWPVRSLSLECGPRGDCAEGFLIGDVAYDLSCGQVRPRFVTAHRLAEGAYPVNVIEGQDPRVMVAYRAEARSCSGAGESGSRQAWHFAFARDRLDAVPDAETLCALGDHGRPGQPTPGGC